MGRRQARIRNRKDEGQAQVSELKVNKVTPATGTQVELEAATVLVDGALRVTPGTINGTTAVSLQHNGSTKLATSTTGVTVTGTVTATAFSGDGSGLSGLVGVGTGGSSSTGALTLLSDSNNTGVGDIVFKTGATEIGRIYRTSGDVAFDTNTLYVDSSANNVGIGNSAPAAKLDVTGTVRASDVVVTTGQIVGGFGAEAAGGTDDWNHSSNARSGSGYTLLRSSTSSNQPTSYSASTDYFHPFSFEYISKDGSGNMCQLAFPYSTPLSGIHYRTRLTGTWAAWRSLVTMPNATTPAISVDASSNVGINDVTPSYKLDVNGEVRATGRLRADAGLQFLAAAVAQSDANCLDDYEEGTWTPAFALSGGTGANLTAITYGTRVGKYTKVGRLVIFTAEIPVTTGPTTSTGTGSAVVISGLPFAANGPGTCHVGSRSGTWGTNKPSRGYISSTSIFLVADSITVNVTALNTPVTVQPSMVALAPADIQGAALTGTTLRISGAYFIS